VGNVGEAPRVSERDGEDFVANFPLATNEFYRNKEGEEVNKTEWQQSVVYDGTLKTQYLRRLPCLSMFIHLCRRSPEYATKNKPHRNCELLTKVYQQILLSLLCHHSKLLHLL
jgi:hypothetical protein